MSARTQTAPQAHGRDPLPLAQAEAAAGVGQRLSVEGRGWLEWVTSSELFFGLGSHVSVSADW